MKPIQKNILIIFLIISFILNFLLIAGLVTAYSRSHRKHVDSFYDINGEMDRKRIPLIKPIDMILLSSPEAWTMEVLPGFYVDDPDNENPYYLYGHVHLVEKFAVQEGIIMAYSPYIDENADTYIQTNYYHWFVLIPVNDVVRGFHTEDEFNQYIQMLGIDDPDWQNPDEVYRRYSWTGCLDWIPDCK